jgi:Mg-chelatase subunit ChlD
MPESHASIGPNGITPRIAARWDRPVVAVDGGEAALLVRIVAPETADAERRAPLDVAFVLDRSGSMSGGKLELAKTGVDLAMTHLHDADRVAAVVYDDEVDLLQPLASATPRVKAGLRLALHGVDPGGSTFLSGGWTAGCRELAEAPAVAGAEAGRTRIRRVILLTDGLANVGIVAPLELARHAGELRRRGIATTAVGVGQDFDEGLLSAMAEAGSGHFEYAPHAEALRGFFARELRQMTGVAVTGLTVTVAIPAGVRGELLSIFPIEARDGALEVAIGDLHAGDTIDLLFIVRFEAGALGGALPVAVRAAWVDALADARRDADVALEPLRYGGDAELAAEPDAEVAEQAALQRAAAERRAGLELDRLGDHMGSRARMARSLHLLEAAPMTARVQEEIAESAALSAAPPTMAYDSHTRKSAQFQQHLRRRGYRDDDD